MIPHRWHVLMAISTTVLLSAALYAQDEATQLDPGGTAFPYPEPRAVQATGENVAPDPSFEKTELKTKPPGWFVGFHVYTPRLEAERGKKIRERVGPAVEMKLAEARARTGKKSIYLRVPGTSWRKGDLNFSARCQGEVVLPQEYERIAVQFAYRMKREPPAPGKGRVMVHFLDADGKPTVHWKQFSLNPAPDWIRRTLTFKPEQGTRRIGLTFYLDGCGTAEYDDLAIFPIAPDEKGITIRCVPMQFLDGTFALSEGDPGLIQFGCKSEDKKPAARPNGVRLKRAQLARDPHVLIALPEGVRFTSWASQMRLAEKRPHQQDGVSRTLYDFEVRGFASYIGSEHDTRTGMSLLLQTDVKAGTRLPPMLYWLEYAPAKNAPRIKTQAMPLKLTVLPSIRARTPKDFVIGAMLRKPSRYVGGGPEVKPYADFIKRCGINWIPGGAGTAVGRYAQDMGLTVLCESGMSNAYTFGWGAHPKEWAFIRADGQPFPRAICPTVIYRRLPYYVEKVYEGNIRKFIAVDKTADGFNANWEPYMYFDKGCFCERCKKEFIAYSKLPAEQVERLWPLGILKEHRDLWNLFSAWQHGRVAVTLDQDCKRAGRERGIKSYFIPEVTPTIFGPDAATNSHAIHTDPAEYVKELTQYSSWGGYWSFDYLSPDVRAPVGRRLGLLTYTQWFGDWVDRHCPPDKRPRLHWLYHSYQGGRRVTFPEALTFDILCCCVVGLDGAWAYVFPKGYDNRYWQALALGADTVAEFEPYVRHGRRQTQHTIEPVTPTPKVEAGELLRSWEFARDRRRLFAVGNFWMGAETFFKLNVSGLDADARYVLREPRARRHFESPSRNPYWTGRELASGALLHVGAMRWAFFEIQPHDGSAPGVALSHKAMQDALAGRRPGIDKAYKDALHQISASVRAKTGEQADYSGLRSIAAGDLRCAPKDVNDDGHPELVFTRPGETLVVEPSKGGRILSWRLGDFDVAHAEGLHALAVDAFWLPGYFVGGQAQVIEQKATEAGLIVRTQRILPKASRGLGGMKVTREILVSKVPGEFRVTTVIENATDAPRKFSFRYGNMPAFLTLPKGGEGWADMLGPDGPTRFTRKFLKTAYHLASAPKNPALDRYRMDAAYSVSDGTVRFACSWSPVRVEATVPLDKLYKIVFWDAGSQNCATTEWVFREVELKPGERWETHIVWRSLE